MVRRAVPERRAGAGGHQLPAGPPTAHAAGRHNQPDGFIDLATGTSDRRAFVQVANGGPAIPPDQVEALFEPFRRLNGRVAGRGAARGAPAVRVAGRGAARGAPAVRGAGLGLSIVRSVARAHGGHAHATALPNGGLEVTVWLPVHAATSAAIPVPRQAPFAKAR